MKKPTYTLDDEPIPDQALQKAIVDPMWPLLATMMAGVWLGWPWLLLNARALGSPSWRAQRRLLLIGLAGAAAMAVAIVAMLDADIITSRTQLRIALLAVTAWKLGISYKVHALQLGTFALYRHYEGEGRSGLVPLLLGMFVGRPLVLGLVDSALWIIVVSGGADHAVP